MYEVKKDLRDVLQEYVFLNPVHKKFVRNLMWKSLRSISASPDRIRVFLNTV